MYPSQLPPPFALANLARLSYPAPGQLSTEWQKSLPESLEQWGGSDVVSYVGENAEAFATTLNSQRVFVVRGTEDALDIINDLRSAKRRVSHDIVRAAEVGKGFEEHASQLRAWVADSLTEDPCVFVGHSLGGACATILCADALHLKLDVAGLVTFGCPRVGNEAFATAVDLMMSTSGGHIARFVSRRDVVTQVPIRKFGFRHVGAPYYFRCANRRQMTGDMAYPHQYGSGWAMWLDRWFDRYRCIGRILRTSIDDHSMLHSYIPQVKAAFRS